MLLVDVFRSMIIHTANVKNYDWRRPWTVSYCGSRNSSCLKNSPRNITVLSTCVEKLREKVIVFYRFLLGRLGMLCWKDPWKLYFTLHKVCAVHKQHSLYSSLHFTNLTTTISMVFTLMDHQSFPPISGHPKIADIAKNECESMTSIKCHVRTCHIEVVQWTSKRCVKSVVNMQGCCFAHQSIFFTFYFPRCNRRCCCFKFAIKLVPFDVVVSWKTKKDTKKCNACAWRCHCCHRRRCQRGSM